MDIAPFFDASLAVQLHVVAALVALATGSVVFIMRKGTGRHKATGRVWFTAMVAVAISSFGIRGLMPNGSLSPSHLLSVYTLATLVFAIGMALIVTLAVFALVWLFDRDAYGKTWENRRGR